MDKENNPSLNNDEYKVEISENKGFFSSLIDKFKRNSNQKLLASGSSTKTHTTNRSISSMWEFGSFRASFFNALESIRGSIFKPKSTEVKNGFATEIIGDNSNNKVLDNSEPTTPFKDPEKKVIIPKTQNPQLTNIIDNVEILRDLESINLSDFDNSSLEIAEIDTSAIIEEVNKKKSTIPNIKTTNHFREDH